VQTLIERYHPRRIVIFSRDELKQHEMRESGLDHESLRWFIGDVRDRDRLLRAMSGIDVVIHAAALKQVPACEYNPSEAVKTNVDGARNVIDAAIDCGVQRVLALSTDKAVNPVNLYGATKLCAEKLFVQGNAYSADAETRFACTRYGNVIGSRGSIIPLLRAQRSCGRIRLTDTRMSRFWLTLDQGVEFVLSAIESMQGGEIFVPKIPSMRLVDLARAIAPACAIRCSGIRPGEKLHETLLSADEARHAVDVGDCFVIQPEHSWWAAREPAGLPLPEDFSYSSDNNHVWLTVEELRELIGETLEETAACN